MAFQGHFVIQDQNPVTKLQAVADAEREAYQISTMDRPRLIMATDGSFCGGSNGGRGGSAVVWKPNWLPGHDPSGDCSDDAAQRAQEESELGEEAVAFRYITSSGMAELCALSLALHVVDHELRLHIPYMKQGTVLMIVIISDCAPILRMLSAGKHNRSCPRIMVDFINKQSAAIYT